MWEEPPYDMNWRAAAARDAALKALKPAQVGFPAGCDSFTFHIIHWST